ncbi:hypothetical protein [Cupriavidus sp. 2SB]|uniref:hypothetical protein n=1 Tax=Cupriavidus sp. 2SB TaxID=2502199 RepID=UPI0010F98554|nr:hypothetical protein [Cupriavidus sp. 2SB]
MAKTLTNIELLALPLCQQALAMEERRHKARIQELKDMAASLAALEAMQAAIKAAGHTLYADTIAPVYGKRQTLRITTHFTSAEVSLTKALLTVGFAIVERGEGLLRSVLLKKGRLSIQVFTSEENLARAEGEFETALIAAAAPLAKEAA